MGTACVIIGTHLSDNVKRQSEEIFMEKGAASEAFCRLQFRTIILRIAPIWRRPSVRNWGRNHNRMEAALSKGDPQAFTAELEQLFAVLQWSAIAFSLYILPHKAM